VIFIEIYNILSYNLLIFINILITIYFLIPRARVDQAMKWKTKDLFAIRMPWWETITWKRSNIAWEINGWTIILPSIAYFYYHWALLHQISK